MLDASVSQHVTRAVVLGNGKAFVALSGNAPRANVLLELNLATGEQRVRTHAADADGVASASWMQRAPDRLAFVFKIGGSRFRRYDAATDQFAENSSGAPPSGGGRFSVSRGAAYSADGRLIYDASLTFVRRVESIWGASSGVMATSLSGDGEYLYIGGRPRVMRSRVSDGKIVDRIMNPVPADIFRVASDDSFVVTATEIGVAQVSLIRMR